MHWSTSGCFRGRFIGQRIYIHVCSDVHKYDAWYVVMTMIVMIQPGYVMIVMTMAMMMAFSRCWLISLKSGLWPQNRRKQGEEKRLFAPCLLLDTLILIPSGPELSTHTRYIARAPDPMPNQTRGRPHSKPTVGRN